MRKFGPKIDAKCSERGMVFTAGADKRKKERALPQIMELLKV